MITAPLAASRTCGGGRGVIFREVDPGYLLDYHPAPRRQLVVNLTGSVEIDTGEEARVFGPGSIMLAEDTTGRGPGVIFREVGADYELDFHVAPRAPTRREPHRVGRDRHR